MGKVIASASTSLDGFIAYRDNSVGHLFDWYTNGDIEVANAGELPPFKLSPASAEHWKRFRAALGAVVVGRTQFDYTDGWRGQHPLGVPIVVLTHQAPTDWSYPGSENFSFVSDGIEAAIDRAQQLAGDAVVSVAAGTVAGQALDAGLLDQVNIDLVPIVMGDGRRYFGESPGTTHQLGDPTSVVQGKRVTHLAFPISPTSTV